MCVEPSKCGDCGIKQYLIAKYRLTRDVSFRFIMRKIVLFAESLNKRYMVSFNGTDTF